MKRLWLVLIISVMAIFSTGCSIVISMAQQAIQTQQQTKQQPVAKKEQDKPKKEQEQQQNDDDLSDIAQAPNNQDDDSSLNSDDSSDQENPEDKNIHVDGRTWTPVDVHAQNDGNVRVLYVPEGQSADDWTEAITIDVHKGLQNQATVNDYAKEMRKSINEQVRNGGKVTWRTLSKQQDDLMYEFIIENDGYQDNQHEISRVVATDEGIVALHYTNKLSVPMSEDERQKWIQILQAEDPSDNSSDGSSGDFSDGSTTDDSSDSNSSDTL
ncbi:hypothetical protein [Polycladomyces subterraneus]|uniref:PsbP C-terminal domain-containing protein n=1 Tax=Polycladomyces subterraneus TaxID=1016997 RepID=A0ABT8IMD5_9BACL|nr:hypothetical protein [Polycladomyces subterraneus]MDN4593537.1 hypothetical protein [Polycladomyces subterraneus]